MILDVVVRLVIPRCITKLHYTTFAELPVIYIFGYEKDQSRAETYAIFSVKRAETEWDFVVGHLCKGNLKVKVCIQQSSQFGHLIKPS